MRRTTRFVMTVRLMIVVRLGAFNTTALAKFACQTVISRHIPFKVAFFKVVNIVLSVGLSICRVIRLFCIRGHSIESVFTVNQVQVFILLSCFIAADILIFLIVSTTIVSNSNDLVIDLVICLAEEKVGPLHFGIHNNCSSSALLKLKFWNHLLSRIASF